MRGYRPIDAYLCACCCGIVVEPPYGALKLCQCPVRGKLQSHTSRSDTDESPSEDIGLSIPEPFVSRGSLDRKDATGAAVQNPHLSIVAGKGRGGRQYLRQSAGQRSFQVVQQRLIVGVHRAKAVTEKMQLVLQAKRWRVPPGVHRQPAARSSTARHDAPIRPRRSRRIGVAVTWNRTNAQRRPDQTPHRGLHRNRSSLVERAHHDAR